MKQSTVYYAHPIALYKTEVEREDITLLKKLGFKVLNPAEHPNLEMADYVKLAQSCDVFAFRAFQDGKIGSGVGLEIEGAKAKKIPVIELPWVTKKRTLSRNETRGGCFCRPCVRLRRLA